MLPFLYTCRSYSGFEFNPYTDVGSALVQKVATQVRATNYLNPLAKVMEVIAAVQSLFPVFVTKSLLVVPSTFILTHYPGPLRVLHDPKFATLLDIIPAIDSLGGGKCLSTFLSFIKPPLMYFAYFYFIIK